jgi:ketosteroid isomerase-like protein
MYSTDDVAKAYQAWDDSFNKGDAATLGSAYLPDAKVLPPTHSVVSGTAEIERFFASLFQSGVTSHKLDVIEASGDGRFVYGTARWSAAGKGTNGSPQSLGGFATHVFERQGDGSLKLRLHTFN